MEIRELRYFLSVVRHGSLVAAAREHFVTQPAISLQLKKLEERLGEKLYVRRGRRVVPTPAGRVVASHADELLQRLDRLERAVEGLRGGRSGQLRLGSIDAASIYVLPGVFRSFRARYGGVDIDVRVADTDTLLAALEAGSVEVAIVTLPLPTAAHEIVPFFEDRMVLVAGERHALVTDPATRRYPLRAVADRGLITYPASSTTRRLIDRVFLDHGLRLRAAMEMSSPEAIKHLTEAGLGASILPRRMVSADVRSKQLRIVPTGKARFSRMLGIVFRDEAGLSEPAANFVRLLARRYPIKGKTG